MDSSSRVSDTAARFGKEETIIDINNYQILAMRTARKDESIDGFDVLLEGVLGMNGEAGECADIVKKHVFHGHEFDRNVFAKELGDVLWYVARSADAIGMSLEEVADLNIKKLEKRYPQGFDSIRSINRTE